MTAVPAEGWAAALAGLPAMGPARLRAVLSTWPAEEAWARVVAGTACDRPAVALACRPDPRGVAASWQIAARRVDVADGWEAHGRAGVAVLLPGTPGFPTALEGDPEPPAVLFSRGDPGVLDGRRVAIVGTRRCTRYGREVAHELGRDLAAAGVRVVSGLALGVDGAAHRGALAAGAAPPVAVVGSGLDVVYPRSHGELWKEVAGAGLLLSEAPLGARPEPWRFPVRNRVIAALAELVVVVESAEKGGSRHTVDAAMARDRPVMAVPGSVRSPVSAYPNSLLADGCHPVRDPLDVLVALGLSSAPSAAADVRPPPGPDEAVVLEALGWEPATFDALCARTGRSPGQVSVALPGCRRPAGRGSAGAGGSGPGDARRLRSCGRPRCPR
ncbi:MAG TPA: DNA-protecting protein DprA [Acidimicrobiales bacterium]|nr:DNA-protecting protein DprA [Acidimicrobiales bacterium]